MSVIVAFYALSPDDREDRLTRLEHALRRKASLEAVAKASWGAVTLYDPDGERFGEALLRLNNFLNEHHLPKVGSQNSFVRFLRREMRKPRAISVAGLALYLLHLRATQKNCYPCINQIENVNSESGGLFDKIEQFLVDGNARPLFAVATDLNNGNAEHSVAVDGEKPLIEDRALIANLFMALNESKDGRDILFTRAFGRIAPKIREKYDNEAYFSGYRYSTKDGKIVKTFLVVQTPTASGAEYFTYTHVLEGGETLDRHGNEIRKVSRGFIVNWRTTTYLIGGIQRHDSVAATNIEIIAIERDHLLSRDGVIPALIMSSAAVDQPIVSRMSLVGLGNKIEFGKKMWDHDVEPTEIDAVNLGNNLRNDVERLRERGFNVKVDPKRLEMLIIETINNISLWERAHDRAVENCGALESWREDARA